ncbi:hypothetical protein BABINDRAFT_163225 [Babjeviella inositovora NRRL Y-12698]|uniref:AB hydrolase-1 domain-containing protein n=1 Tax=Babjeviella inositovora NRRL Y-12698 TaxID=984486 RepID=A0A1E3QJK9_9ASCO|nr:uncharacterized protein BABINDRAFT_163225 [Babjeviella inositovora NRRL Y-12698]ODQ77840.1 hypothetical protein BABINDRAFT_163225 [Babjeviella inositovora NRRL Y-12698]
MPFGINFVSQIKHFASPAPVRLPSKEEGQSFTLAEIVAKYAPSLEHGASALMSPFLCNGHLQTMYAGIGNFEEVNQIYYRRELLQFEDGGVASVDHVVHLLKEKFDLIDDLLHVPASQKFDLPPRTKYYSPQEVTELRSDDHKPLIICLHGLSGGSYESYVRCFLEAITSEPYGFEACVLNARGCANTSLTTSQLFCGVWTNDIRDLIAKLRKDYPNRLLYAVGFSLGGSILANYLGQESDDCPLTAAAVIATPWDLNDSSIQIESSYIGHNVYSRAMTENLYRLVDMHYDALSESEVMENYAAKRYMAKTLRQFDDLFTSRLFGFNNAGQYYRTGSPINRIYKIRTPTLILNALDDPIAASTSYPYKEATLNPYTLFATSSLGGHIGWFTPSLKRWYSEPLSQFFHGVHQALDHNKELEVDKDSLPMETKWVKDRLDFKRD